MDKTETKYGQYILRATRQLNPDTGTSPAIPVEMEGREDWNGIRHRMKWTIITRPFLMVETPHSHDFDEYLAFLSIDPAKEREFGAEVELSLGQECEKQIINVPTIVCIPRGLTHGPVNFKTITKNILFCHIYTSPEYVRIPAV